MVTRIWAFPPSPDVVAGCCSCRRQTSTNATQTVNDMTQLYRNRMAAVRFMRLSQHLGARSVSP